MFTLEITGRPVAAISTHSEAVAEEAFRGRHFREDLRWSVDGSGVPLWDGRAPFHLRRSLPEEVAELRAAFQAALAEGALSLEDEDAYVIFVSSLST